MKLSWKDNRGFTLVELVISMGVLAIVGVTISILMLQGSKHYSNAKSELDLQMESQTVMAQLNTMIMESYQMNYDPANHVMTLYQAEVMPASAGAVATAYITDVKFVEHKGNALYLYEHDHDQQKPASGGSVTCPGCGKYGAGETADDHLMAEYIEDFSVTPVGDLTDENRTATIHLKMKSGKRQYEADTSTKIRNRLVVFK